MLTITGSTVKVLGLNPLVTEVSLCGICMSWISRIKRMDVSNYPDSNMNNDSRHYAAFQAHFNTLDKMIKDILITMNSVFLDDSTQCFLRLVKDIQEL